jgi:hypothetical protein
VDTGGTVDPGHSIMATRTHAPRTRRPRTRWWFLSTLLLLALVATACGGADAGVEDDPEDALRDALEELADYDGFELLFQLSADEEARAQALREDDFTEEELERLLTASVLVRTTAQGDEDEGAAEVILTVDDEQVAELRVLPDMDLYLRLDLDGIAELSEDPEMRREIDELAGQAEAFGLRDAVEAAQRGDWIRVTGFEQLINLFGDGPAAEDTTTDEEEAERLSEEIADAAIRFVDEDVSVAYVGSDDAGERVRATTDGAALQRFLDEVGSIAATSDALGGTDPQELAGDLEIDGDQRVTLDAWISGGRLTQVAVDLGALDEGVDTEGELLLVIGIDEFTGTIDTPDDAAQVDLFGLIGGFMGGLGGSGQEPFEDGTFDEDPEGEPDQDVEDGLDEDGFDEDGFDEGEACITEEEIEEMRDFLEPEEQEELDAAIEAGILPVC